MCICFSAWIESIVKKSKIRGLINLEQLALKREELKELPGVRVKDDVKIQKSKKRFDDLKNDSISKKALRKADKFKEAGNMKN